MSSAPEPSTHDDDVVLPTEAWRALEAELGDALDLFSVVEPLRSLEMGPWSVFVALVRCWRRAGVSPGPAELAAICRCSQRSLYRYLGDLQAVGVVRPVGPRNNGRYTVGPALDPILRTFARDRDPALWRGFEVTRSAGVALGAGDIEAGGSPSASLALDPSATVAVVPVQPTASASLAHDPSATLAVAPVQPTASASLARDPSATVALATVHPTPSASLARDPSATVALATVQPTASASLALPSRSSERGATAPISQSLPPVRPPECHPGTRVDPTRPETTSLLKKNKDLNSSSSCVMERPRRAEPIASPTPPTSSGRPLDATASRKLACAALMALHRHAYPDIPPPRMLDPGDVALVERCGARGTWDLATLEQMHLDAIQGACRTSSGPPRPMYIWGDFGNFLDHVQRGRLQRERDQAKPPPRRPRPEPEESFAPPEWVAGHIGALVRQLDGRPREADAPSVTASSPPSDS